MVPLIDSFPKSGPRIGRVTGVSSSSEFNTTPLTPTSPGKIAPGGPIRWPAQAGVLASLSSRVVPGADHRQCDANCPLLEGNVAKNIPPKARLTAAVSRGERPVLFRQAGLL